MSGVVASPPMVIDGRCLSVTEFAGHVAGLALPRIRRVYLHHTWKPRAWEWRGAVTIRAMKAYYEQQLWTDERGVVHRGWTVGPHLFIAWDGIWLFTSLREDGAGVLGDNLGTRHVEMVGDYDAAPPIGATWDNTIAALSLLLEAANLDPWTLAFHRDRAPKTCPGKAVSKALVIRDILEYRLRNTPPLKGA